MRLTLRANKVAQEGAYSHEKMISPGQKINKFTNIFVYEITSDRIYSIIFVICGKG
jgi:hypothetical protein